MMREQAGLDQVEAVVLKGQSERVGDDCRISAQQVRVHWIEVGYI